MDLLTMLKNKSQSLFEIKAERQRQLKVIAEIEAMDISEDLKVGRISRFAGDPLVYNEKLHFEIMHQIKTIEES
jgi:hypothetical protein